MFPLDVVKTKSPVRTHYSSSFAEWKRPQSYGTTSSKTLRLRPGCHSFQGLNQGLLCDVVIQMFLNVDISVPAGMGFPHAVRAEVEPGLHSPPSKRYHHCPHPASLHHPSCRSLLPIPFFFPVCASHVSLLFWCFCFTPGFYYQVIETLLEVRTIEKLR